MAIATVAAPQGHHRRRADQRARRGRAAPGHADARPAAGRARRRGRADRPRHGARSPSSPIRSASCTRAGSSRSARSTDVIASAAPSLHAAPDRQPARLDEQAGAARHPRPAAAPRSTCRRGVQLQAALPVRLRPLPRETPHLQRGRAGPGRAPATSIRQHASPAGDLPTASSARDGVVSGAHRAPRRAQGVRATFTAPSRDISLVASRDGCGALDDGDRRRERQRQDDARPAAPRLHHAERRPGHLPGPGPRRACRAPSSASSAARSSRSSRIPFDVFNPFYRVDHVLHTPIRRFGWPGSPAEARATDRGCAQPRRAAAGRHPRALSARAERRAAPAGDGGARGAAAPADDRGRRAGVDGRRLAPRDDPRRAAHAQPGPRHLDRLHHPRPHHRVTRSATTS